MGSFGIGWKALGHSYQKIYNTRSLGPRWALGLDFQLAVLRARLLEFCWNSFQHFFLQNFCFIFFHNFFPVVLTPAYLWSTYDTSPGSWDIAIRIFLWRTRTKRNWVFWKLDAMSKLVILPLLAALRVLGDQSNGLRTSWMDWGGSILDHNCEKMAVCFLIIFVFERPELS